MLANIYASFPFNTLAKRDRYSLLALDIAGLTKVSSDLFTARLLRFDYLSSVGRYQDAEVVWNELDSMGREWSRSTYLPGTAETQYAWFRLYEGNLNEEVLAKAEKLVKTGKHRVGIRSLHNLRGVWHLRHGRWSSAAESFGDAVQMARSVGQSGPSSETGLALAKFHLGLFPNARQDAEQLAAAKSIDHQLLAELWLGLNDEEQAQKHALEAYREAWADGEPYVRRYYLDKARDLLNQLGVEIPTLPAYDPVKDEKLPWEDELLAAVEKLRAEKKAERRKRSAKKKRDR